jgi:hypothetical protein
MTIRDHYVIVAVTPQEVQFERESLTQSLAAIPLLGLLLEAWLAPAGVEQRAAMFDALEERLGRIETGLRDIEGCSAHYVDAGEASTLIGEFWAGEPREYEDTDRVLRTRPMVGERR